MCGNNESILHNVLKSTEAHRAVSSLRQYEILPDCYRNNYWGSNHCFHKARKDIFQIDTVRFLWSTDVFSDVTGMGDGPPWATFYVHLTLRLDVPSFPSVVWSGHLDAVGRFAKLLTANLPQLAACLYTQLYLSSNLPLTAHLRTFLILEQKNALLWSDMTRQLPYF